jgi:hypothetical protein
MNAHTKKKQQLTHRKNKKTQKHKILNFRADSLSSEMMEQK